MLLLAPNSLNIKTLTKPVADEITFSSIYKKLDSILDKSRNANFEIPHPVDQHDTKNEKALRR